MSSELVKGSGPDHESSWMQELNIDPSKIAPMELQVSHFYKSESLKSIDLGPYRPPMMEDVLDKEFREAADNKQAAIALPEGIARTIKTARKAHIIGVPAAVASHLAKYHREPFDYSAEEQDQSEQSDSNQEIRNTQWARDKVLGMIGLFKRNPEDGNELPTVDNLREAVQEHIGLLNDRRAALVKLQEAARGVYAATEGGIVKRSSMQAGAVVRDLSNKFEAAHQDGQMRIDTVSDDQAKKTAELHMKESALESAQRNSSSVAWEYKSTATKLNKLKEDLAEHVQGINDAKVRIAEIEQNNALANQEIANLQRKIIAAEESKHGEAITPEQLAHSLEIITDGRDEIENNLTPKIASGMAHISMINEYVLALTKEAEKLTNSIRDLLDKESSMRGKILEEVIQPVATSITPSILESLEEYRRDRASNSPGFQALGEKQKNYGEEEDWINKTFMPEILAGGINIGTAEMCRFLDAIPVIVELRTESISRERRRSSETYGEAIVKTTHETAEAGLRNLSSSHRASSEYGYARSALRTQLEEEARAANEELQVAVKDLDYSIALLESKTTEHDNKLDSIGDAAEREDELSRDLYAKENEMRKVRGEAMMHLASIADLHAELIEADEARVEQLQQVFAAFNPDDESLDEIPLSADNTAGDYAEVIHENLRKSRLIATNSADRFRKLHQEAWTIKDRQNTQNDRKVERIGALYKIREEIITMMEQSGSIGHDTLTKWYEKVEALVASHAGVAVPQGMPEERAHLIAIERTGAQGITELREMISGTPKPENGGFVRTLGSFGKKAISALGMGPEKSRNNT